MRHIFNSVNSLSSLTEYSGSRMTTETTHQQEANQRWQKVCPGPSSPTDTAPLMMNNPKLRQLVTTRILHWYQWNCCSDLQGIMPSLAPHSYQKNQQHSYTPSPNLYEFYLLSQGKMQKVLERITINSLITVSTNMLEKNPHKIIVHLPSNQLHPSIPSKESMPHAQHSDLYLCQPHKLWNNRKYRGKETELHQNCCFEDRDIYAKLCCSEVTE